MNKPIFTNNIPSLNFGVIVKVIFAVALEASLFLLFYVTYLEAIGSMGSTYLADIPVIGLAFAQSDASQSDLIALLLAVFSIGTVIYLWNEFIRLDLLNDFQNWISHPPHQIIFTLITLIFLLVLAIEMTAMYTVIAKQSVAMTGGFIQESADNNLMDYLSQNKGMALGVSLIIAIVNIVISLFTVKTFKSLGQN